MSAEQTSLGDFAGPDLSVLTERQREVYRAVRLEGVGAREWARREGVSPGTVSNLLRRAEQRLDEEGVGR